MLINATVSAAAATNATMAISTVSGELVAPVEVWFEANTPSGFSVSEDTNLANYDPSFHDITSIWNFDDAGGYDASLNIPTAWDNRNVAYGKMTCHVFRTAGTYTVTHWGRDSSGNLSETTTEIVVTDPDTTFATTRTICVDLGSNFTGAPEGSQQFNTVAAALTAINAATQSVRVLFRRGSDQELQFDINGAGFDQNIHFGAYGTGARPILRPPYRDAIFKVNQNCLIKDMTYSGLDLRGRWDSVLEAGSNNDRAFGVETRNVSELTTLVFDCRISGMATVDISTLKALNFTSVICDTTITEWCKYGIYCDSGFDGVTDGQRFAMMGVSIADNVDTCDGRDTGNFDGAQNQNGPFRYNKMRKVVARSTYLFSNHSWSLGHQPCIRMQTGNAGSNSAVYDRMVCEGGSEIVGAGGSPLNPVNYLWDKMLLVGTAHTNEMMNVGVGGQTFQNVHTFQPSYPSYIGYGANTGAIVNSTGNGADTRALVLTGCTFYDNSTGTVRSLSDLATDFSGLSFVNEVLQEPNKTAPDVGDEPFTSAAIAGVAPTYDGTRDSISAPVSVEASAISNGGTLTFALPKVQTKRGSLTDRALTTGEEALLDDTHNLISIVNLDNGGSGQFSVSAGEISVSIAGSVITVTNTSGGDIPAAATRGWALVMPNTGITVRDTSYTSPATVPMITPASGSAAFETATGDIAYDNFFGDIRPGTGFPGATAGSSSKGAV
jgi:hypothetical protein